MLALGFLSGKINTLFSKSGNVLNNVTVAAGPVAPPPPPSPPANNTAGSSFPSNSNVANSVWWNGAGTVPNGNNGAPDGNSGLYTDVNGMSGSVQLHGGERLHVHRHLASGRRRERQLGVDDQRRPLRHLELRLLLARQLEDFVETSNEMNTSAPRQSAPLGNADARPRLGSDLAVGGGTRKMEIRNDSIARGSSRARDERGQGLVEYALIIALVSLAAVLALGFLSGKINNLFSKSGNVLNNVAIAAPPGGGTGGPPAVRRLRQAAHITITCSGGDISGGVLRRSGRPRGTTNEGGPAAPPILGYTWLWEQN